MAELNAVIDLSHYNQNLDFSQIKNAGGMLGVIHKATQGITHVDPTYQDHMTEALDVGLFWGAYHFGTGSDGVDQAQHFLEVVSPNAQTLLVLDFEADPQGPSMSLEEARAFVTHINQETGRWPMLYSGYYIKQLLGSSTDPVLANCSLWLAQYGPTAVVPPNWDTWTLWQYTNGAKGPMPHDVPGAGLCDRDKFNGDQSGLEQLWGVTLAEET